MQVYGIREPRCQGLQYCTSRSEHRDQDHALQWRAVLHGGCNSLGIRAVLVNVKDGRFHRLTLIRVADVVRIPSLSCRLCGGTNSVYPTPMCSFLPSFLPSASPAGIAMKKRVHLGEASAGRAAEGRPRTTTS